jgi:hypothetical protein
MIIKRYRLIEAHEIFTQVQGTTASYVVPAGTEFELPDDMTPSSKAVLIGRRVWGEEQELERQRA